MKLAVTSHREGRLQEAEAYYRSILAAFPHHPDANHNLGIMCRQVGKHPTALPFLQTALTANPASLQYSVSYADALLATGHAAQALDVLKNAMPFGDSGLGTLASQLLDKAQAISTSAPATEPSPAEIEQLIGLFNSRRFAELEIGAQTLTARFPDSGVLWKLQCAALQMQGKDALNALQNAARLMPEDPELQSNLGIALRKAGDLDGAIASYRRALALRPSDADTHSNLGVALGAKALFDDAAESFQKASELRPDNSTIHNNLAATLVNVGKLSESLNSTMRVLELDPDNLDARSRALFIHHFFSEMPPEAMLAESRKFGDLVASKVTPFSAWPGELVPDRRLRIGFVSGDLRDHPVGYFVENVFQELARNHAASVELVAYSNHIAEDRISQKIKSCCKVWHMVEWLSDEQLTALIRQDAIDILIDLSGHTAGNRLPVFARKPAPVQATWLGYFATTGFSAIDYLIADPHGVPDGEEGYFTEEVWKLPETRLCFAPPDLAPDVVAPPCLEAGYVTFGCFNKLTKMTDAVVALWARVLQAVPDSRLLLKASMLKSKSRHREVIDRFAAHGIAAERLILQGPSPRDEYLAAYGQIDIALDPFPFTGGTTTVETLWMGVPVLTLAGDRLLSRQSAGILKNVGLPEWIANSQGDYLDKAVSAAGNADALAELRSGLRQRLSESPLCDATRFAAQFDSALRGMWRRNCESLSTNRTP